MPLYDLIWNLIDAEEDRQRRNLELIASENYTSPEILAATGSCCMFKYAEGYPGRRYYGGCENIDAIETAAIQEATKLFGADHANVQPHSGSQANFAAYAALLNPGDTILSASMNAGGHLTHSSPVSFVSTLYNVVTYDVGDDGFYDMEEVRRIAKETHPKLIVAGASSYPRLIDYEEFRKICDEVGAYLMVDMAHVAGLVAGKVIPSPVPYADIVTTTTHKTLRGPRGGMILCRLEHAKAVDNAIFPYSQGGGLQNIVAAKAICLHDAGKLPFKRYAQQVIDNAQALGTSLIKQGLKLVTNGTDNHMLLLDLSDIDITGKELEKRLDQAYITVNKNMIPNDKRPPSKTSGIRIGTAAVTTRGMITSDMETIGQLIGDVIFERRTIEEVKRSVTKLTMSKPMFAARW